MSLRFWKCPLIFRGDRTNVPSFLNPRQNTAHNLTSTWCSLNHCVTGKLTLLPNQQCRLNVWLLYSIYIDILHRGLKKEFVYLFRGGVISLTRTCDYTVTLHLNFRYGKTTWFQTFCKGKPPCSNSMRNSTIIVWYKVHDKLWITNNVLGCSFKDNLLWMLLMTSHLTLPPFSWLDTLWLFCYIYVNRHHIYMF